MASFNPAQNTEINLNAITVHQQEDTQAENQNTGTMGTKRVTVVKSDTDPSWGTIVCAYGLAALVGLALCAITFGDKIKDLMTRNVTDPNP